MTLVGRRGAGAVAAVVALTAGLWTSGCGFGGSTTELEQGQPNVAQLIVLRGGEQARRGLDVLLAKTASGDLLPPSAWVFPAGGVQASNGDADAAPNAALQNLSQAVGMNLERQDLVPYSHWLVPGFNTVFYLALAPANAKPRADGTGVASAEWFEPKEALAMHRSGKLRLDYPTAKQLESLRSFATADDAIESARSNPPQPVQLRVVGTGNNARAVLPKEAP